MCTPENTSGAEGNLGRGSFPFSTAHCPTVARWDSGETRSHVAVVSIVADAPTTLTGRIARLAREIGVLPRTISSSCAVLVLHFPRSSQRLVTLGVKVDTSGEVNPVAYWVASARHGYRRLRRNFLRTRLRCSFTL